MRTEFLIEYRMINDRFALAMRHGSSPASSAIGQWAYAQPISFEVKESGAPIEPAFLLTREDAQALMDELWRAGVRPSNGEGATGQLASTREHLADMRKIVEFMANEQGPLALGEIRR